MWSRIGNNQHLLEQHIYVFLLEAITENENTDLEACVLFFLQGLRNCLPGQAEEDTVGSLSLCTNKSKEYNLNVETRLSIGR